MFCKPYGNRLHDKHYFMHSVLPKGIQSQCFKNVVLQIIFENGS